MKRKRYLNLELYLFLIFSLISIIPFFLVRYVPSLDGPQHLYNARLIAELIKGDEFISQYFRFNPLIVGNLSSQYLMGFLMLLFPAWLAEKIFLSMYIIGMALSFRYFIKSIQKNNSLLYMIIFPFSFTSLFMMGYYNFSVAFIPFFLALGYFKRHETRLGIREALWLTLLSFTIYISHSVVFVFFGLIVFLQLIFDLAYPLFKRGFNLKVWISSARKYLIVVATAIPAIILWGQYYLSLNSGKQDSPEITFMPVSKILDELYKVRILIGFHHGQEAGSNTIMFWCLVTLIILAFIPFRYFSPGFAEPVRKNNPDWAKWTFITITLFFLTIFLPDRMVTGSMSARFSILFFIGLVAWISIQSYPKFIVYLGLVIILGTFAWHRNIIFKFYEMLNVEIADLETVGESVRPNSIIFPVNCSENWLQLHFHCYLGVDKPIIDLRNPQAYGPMPLVWNYDKMPDILLGELDQKQSGVQWSYGNNYLTPVPADYIFIWRAQRVAEVEGVTTFLDKVRPYYSEAFRSKGGSALLLQLKK